jgi:hypothetical protein
MVICGFFPRLAWTGKPLLLRIQLQISYKITRVWNQLTHAEPNSWRFFPGPVISDIKLMVSMCTVQDCSVYEVGADNSQKTDSAHWIVSRNRMSYCPFCTNWRRCHLQDGQGLPE